MCLIVLLNYGKLWLITWMEYPDEYEDTCGSKALIHTLQLKEIELVPK